MKWIGLYSVLALSTLLASTATPTAKGQETREQAAAHLGTPDPSEMDPSFKGSAPYAQKLLDEALKKHPEVLLMAIHAGAPKYDIIASNFGRIGKLGDKDELRCIHTGKDNLEINKEGNHYEDEFSLRDRTGKVIGAVGVVFPYKPGDDKLALQKIAKAISKEMSSHIPKVQRLFGPA